MNINEIIPKTQMSADLSTKIWTSRSINQVLENLDKVTNFMQNSLWWKNSRLSSYAIPTWFCLLNNEKLTDKLLNNGFFIDYLNNTPIVGHKNIVKMSSISNNETVLTNLENMPYLFNFEAKSIKKLIDCGMKVDYSIFSCAWEHPKYALDIIKLDILPFDENKIVNAGSVLYINKSIVKVLIDSTKFEKYEDIGNLTEMFECIKDFIDQGAKDFILVEHVKDYNFSIERLHWHEYAAQTNSQLSVLISKDKITKITEDTSVVKKENEAKKMKL